jgi:hypothetical protein
MALSLLTFYVLRSLVALSLLTFYVLLSLMALLTSILLFLLNLITLSPADPTDLNHLFPRTLDLFLVQVGLPFEPVVFIPACELCVGWNK